MKNDVIVVDGEILENLPNTLFKVRLIPGNSGMPSQEDIERIMICYLSGKMRKNYIKILPGDKVRIELTPYDLQRGRIIYRK
ncbi:MAG: translation initiation factor IF-1 [Patescibacteria group bacterium]|nr:translation initiation factor IF-1 [Patescibacteria group bacterium]